MIYFIEAHTTYQPVLKRIFSLNEKGGISLFASTITLLEVLVKPLREGKTQLAAQYRAILLQASHLELVETSVAVAEKAASLRAAYNLRTPDAIQLATAIEAGADFFLTNDKQLKAVKEIPVLTLPELQ